MLVVVIDRGRSHPFCRGEAASFSSTGCVSHARVSIFVFARLHFW
jgi:hypothetical protein